MDNLRVDDTVTNEHGGKQSHTGTRYDLLPSKALDSIAQVLYHGAIKYGDGNNWKLIPTHEHLDHALRHVFRYLDNKSTEDLSHAATRLLFALTTHLDKES